MSPCWASSITRYTRWGESSTSSRRITWGWCSIFIFLISRPTLFFDTVSASLAFSNVFTATFAPVGWCVPSFTFPYAPSPSSLPNSYSPREETSASSHPIILRSSAMRAFLLSVTLILIAVEVVPAGAAAGLTLGAIACVSFHSRLIILLPLPPAPLGAAPPSCRPAAVAVTPSRPLAGREVGVVTPAAVAPADALFAADTPVAADDGRGVFLAEVEPSSCLR
mmetsp:Transcript_6662/g.16682  ORF Transcript_6662/g.16682 Transcript_6662/m.16682 type:complete len:223 (+) Transcript_6662:2196-2864(+)